MDQDVRKEPHGQLVLTLSLFLWCAYPSVARKFSSSVHSTVLMVHSESGSDEGSAGGVPAVAVCKSTWMVVKLIGMGKECYYRIYRYIYIWDKKTVH